MIKIKRIYNQKEADDGFRILVDRIWPRGISNKDGKIDLWLPEIGSSSGLRKWFGHEDAKWPEFERLYIRELKTKQDIIKKIKDLEKQEGIITLLYSASDIMHNQAVVLQKYIDKFE